VSNRQEKKFLKWEQRSRSRIGDEKFIKKNIPLFKALDLICKIVYPLISLWCLSIMIWKIFVAVNNPAFGNISAIAITFMLFITWCMLTQLYYLYISYAMYGKHIERWSEELENLGELN